MNESIEYYDWVPFFGAICEKITEISKDIEKREEKLFDWSRNTFNSDHAILNYPSIDPFSFIYALAQRNTVNQRDAIFSNAKRSFGIDVEIPSDFTFPTPTPNTLSLFYNQGGYIDKNGQNIGNECLWEMFNRVNAGELIEDPLLSQVLSLKNVGFVKLSQTLFLINPRKFIPFEKQMNSLLLPELGDLKNIVSKIEKEGISVYYNTVELLKQTFVGCELFEINLLNVLVNSVSDNQLIISNRFCQISSWADGQEDSDYFDDFVAQNAVWTGGPAGRTGARIYPLTEYRRGDIVLVRRGTKLLGGVGIILYNQYIPNGFNNDRVIKVLWLVKQNQKIGGTALGQWDGFSNASPNTINHFQELYPNAFQILNNIRNKQRTMINHSAQKYKNLILQGPPGTGKTRLAKQIAQWLTSEEEKSETLIQAIDKRIFQNEPEIEGNEQVKLIQFHPSYTYEDFVRGIKVNANGDKISYDVENRILASFADEAAKPENQQKAFVLIIDEINRANLTAVLGELIYALEYRGKNVNSLYKIKGGSNEIMLPHNLYIIGTMNTADRSVSHIDYAIRRRFTFIPVPSSEAAITNNRAKLLFAEVTKIFDEHTSPEFDQQAIQIGHSYFLVDDNEIEMKLKYEIRPLLLEYINDGVLLESARQQLIDLNA